METALEVLNSVLARSQPHDTVCLTLHEAEMIGGLGEWELGSLSNAISSVGVVRAMTSEGLFAGKVIISNT